MYDSQQIANRIKEQAKEKGVSLKVMLTDCELGINTISQMAKGKDMLSKNLARIADYLGCSVDYLLGREDTAAKSAATAAESTPFAQRRDKNLDRLLHCWDDLNDTGQGKVADYATDLSNNDKYKKFSTSHGGGERMVG